MYRRQPIQTFRLSEITYDVRLQIRDTLDSGAILDYAKAYLAGEILPPGIVFFDGEHYWLTDGFHRFTASKRARREYFDCEVYQGSFQDALDFVLSQVNLKHGIRLSLKDKRKKVKIALQTPGLNQLTPEELSKKLKVSPKLVEGVMRNHGLIVDDLEDDLVTLEQQNNSSLVFHNPIDFLPKDLNNFQLIIDCISKSNHLIISEQPTIYLMMDSRLLLDHLRNNPRVQDSAIYWINHFAIVAAFSNCLSLLRDCSVSLESLYELLILKHSQESDRVLLIDPPVPLKCLPFRNYEVVTEHQKLLSGV